MGKIAIKASSTISDETSQLAMLLQEVLFFELKLGQACKPPIVSIKNRKLPGCLIVCDPELGR